jgi:hypothetical protein
MAAISLAIIGKNNEPLFIKEFFDESNRCSTNFLYEEELFGLPPPKDRPPPACSLRQQFILHSALDRFEQLAGPSPGYAWRTTNASGTDAMFVGLLCPVDDLRVYGKSHDVWIPASFNSNGYLFSNNIDCFSEKGT